jgi:RNA polymerase primary sigma factor
MSALARPLRTIVTAPPGAGGSMTTTPPANPDKRDRSGRERRRAILDVYLDDAGSFDRMSAQDERDAALEIRELRAAYWNALLSCPSLVEWVLASIETEVSAREIPADEIGHVRGAVDAMRENPSEEGARALAAANEALARTMARIDPDNILCHALADAIDGVQCGDEEEEAEVPRPQPEVLQRYNQRVRSARRHLLTARNRFICANLRLVVKVAQRYGRTRMSLADRVQEGNLGLMKAVDRFDPDRGVRFSTYAAWWIRHAVTRALVNRGRTVRIPAHLHTVFTKASHAQKKLRGELGRDPSVAEIAEAIDVPLEKVRAAREAMDLRSIGLDAPVAGEGTPSVADSLEDPNPLDWDDRLDERRNAAIAETAVEGLDPIEADVLKHRYGLRGAARMTLQKLGDRYSLSRERIRQLQNRALKKLRETIERDPRPTLAFA